MIHTWTARLGTNHRLWVGLIFLGLTLLFYQRLALDGLILGRGDAYAYFYPYWDARSAALREGRLPLWTPELFMGAPLLANSQLGTFYPPNWAVTPFDTPTGVTLSLLGHSLWALLGLYRLARRWVNPLAALLAAAIFVFGGYMGAKAEAVNQFQALAWMPWLFWLLERALRSDQRARGSAGLLALGLALQLLAGHPQTVFITLVGLGLYAVTAPPFRLRGGRWTAGLLSLLAAGLLALLLAAPQLIPMLELAGSSNRSGGLNSQQAMAFSFNPYLIGRGLLPSYDALVFGEYVAYVGVIGLGLAVVGALAGPAARRPWLTLALAGFALALGVYNPLYWPLANLPGFSFFRVPARWLALLALGAALLAGFGLHALHQRPPRRWAWLLAVCAGLTLALGLGSQAADRMAADVIGPALPTVATVAGWAAALAALLAALLLWRWRQTALLPTLLCAAALLELFLASQVLAYNEAVPADTYTAQRFTISQLRAYASQQTPPGRVLSISGLLFDPGDRDALIARYRALGMSELAVRIALVDTKQRETLAANLPLTWGVPSVDGFDGGLLPTSLYTQFTALLLPPGELRTIDGRLREILAKPECRGACIPERRWLDLMNVRYLITDKVYDLWFEDVAYDTQFALALQTGDTVVFGGAPPFVADAVDLLYTCGDTDCCRSAACRVPAAELVQDDENAQTARFRGDETGLNLFRLARLTLDEPVEARAVRVTANAAMTLTAVTLVDSRTGAFQQLAPAGWRRVLSSDIKLYEREAPLPRAFVVPQAVVVPDTWAGSEEALTLMRDPAFDPARTAIIAGADALTAQPPLAGAANAIIDRYLPERVEITATSAGGGWLVLTDAYYPGWQAEINGEAVPIYRANVMFRAVQLPAGASRVTFVFAPDWWPWPLAVGGAAWLLTLAGLAVARRRPAGALASSSGRAAL